MSAAKYKIFLVDDDKMLLSALKHRLAGNKMYDISCFYTGEECLKSMHYNPAVVVLDYYLNNKYENAMNGVEILKKIKAEHPLTRVIMLSSQEDADVTSATITQGAYDYVQKSDSAFLKIENMIKNITSSVKLKIDYEKDLDIYKRVHFIAVLIFIVLYILNRLFQN